MAESGGCAGSAAASHVFGVCDLCGEETDQSLAPLVLVQCNQKACPDRVYHQDCLLDHLESASASRRTFYLKKQTYFDLAGFLCVENRHEPTNPRHCVGKIKSSEQLRQLKKAKPAAAKPAPAAQRPAVASVKRLAPRAPAAAPVAATAVEDGGPKVPVGWEPVEEASPKSGGSPKSGAPAPPAAGSGAVPWWLARVEAPAKRDAPPSEAEDEQPFSEPDTPGSEAPEHAAYYHPAYDAAEELPFEPPPAEEAEQPPPEAQPPSAAASVTDEQPSAAVPATSSAAGMLPAVPASQHGLSSSGAALAANTAVRGLFRAALADVAARGLLPLPNASRLSDVMAGLDPAWTQQRKRLTPFSRLFWAYAADVADAGLALVPACDGFALIANGSHGSLCHQGMGVSAVAGAEGMAGATARRSAVAEADEAQAAAVAGWYEARLVASLSNGQWRLLSLLGDRDRGCPVPHNLGCTLKQFCVARPGRFELRWADEAWKVRLVPNNAQTTQPTQPTQPMPMPQQQQTQPMPMPTQQMQQMPTLIAVTPLPAAMPAVAPNPFASAAQQQAALPPRPPGLFMPPGFQQGARFEPPQQQQHPFTVVGSILPPPGFAPPEALQTVSALASMQPQQSSSSYSLFSSSFAFMPPPAMPAPEAPVPSPQRRLYEAYAPPAPPQLSPYSQSWTPQQSMQQPATSHAIFPTPMWSASGHEVTPGLQRTASAPAEAYGSFAPPARNGAPQQQQPRFGSVSTSPRTGRVLPAPRAHVPGSSPKQLPQPRSTILPPAQRPAMAASWQAQAAPCGYDMADGADDDAARHEQLIASLLQDFD